MANSMFVPIEKVPADLDAVRSIIESAFREFSLPVPLIKRESRNPASYSPKDGFTLVEGQAASNQCWFSIRDCPPEITQDPDRSLLVDVKTRGDWRFAAIVAYAFCRFGGRVILNDSGELDGQEKYTADSLKQVLLQRA